MGPTSISARVAMVFTPSTQSSVAADAAASLVSGHVELVGALPWSSNTTYLVTVAAPAGSLLAVYKPRSGERPLWDFPRGSLCLREAAAYLVSQHLGWPAVPATVVRAGPLGPGALQLFVDHDPDEHYLTLTAGERRAALPIAVFDAVVNNADRKSGHVLVDTGGRLWAIDHGVTFHSEPKLRSVIWDFAGEAIPEVLVRDLADLTASLQAQESPLVQALSGLLSASEVEALGQRALELVRSGRLPWPSEGERSVPWPPV